MFRLNNGIVDYVALSTDANSTKLNFLVDSEAHISILKQSALKNKNLLVNFNDITYMRGINDERRKAIGSVLIKIKFRNIVIEHKFYVVEDNFPMLTHGIVGKEFMKRHRCNLDYGKMTLSIRPSDDILIRIPVITKLIDNKTAMPPNSEVFRMFKLEGSIFPCVVEAENITEHIAIPTTIALAKETGVKYHR